MATFAETPVQEFAAEAPALEPEAAMEEQPVEASEMPVYEPQHVVPTTYVYDSQQMYAAPPVTYSAAPVTYMAAPTMMAPPAMVSHYTWNGTQYPSMEHAVGAMMAEAQAKVEAPAAEVEEPKEEPEESPEVKKRSVKPAKKGCC